MKNRRNTVLFLIVLALGAAAGGGWFLTLPQGKLATNASFPGTPVALGTVNVTVEAVSVAEPASTASLRNRTAGYLKYLAAEGTRIKAGDPVVIFDDSDLIKNRNQSDLSLKQAAVALERAEATETKARTDLLNRTALYRDKAATQDQVAGAQEVLFNAQFGTRTAELALEQAKLGVDQARRDWAEATLRASITGTMSKPSLAPGDFAPANSNLGSVIDTSKILFRAEIDEYDIGNLKEGLATTVKVPALGDRTFRAQINAISPAAEVINSISVFRVSILVDNAEGDLRPGMSADITILISQETGLLIPSKAVTTVRSRSYVDVAGENGEAETRRITLGSSDGRNVVVAEGLAAGESVLLPGTAPGAPATAPAAGTSIIPISIPGSGGR